MKSKGLTIIELLVSIVLLSVVMIFVFALLIDIRQEEQRSNFSSADLLNRSIIMQNIQEILLENGLTDIAFTSNSNSQTFTMTHKTSKKTIITIEENKLTLNYNGDIEAWILESSVYDFNLTCYANERKGDKEIITIRIIPDIAGTSLEDNVLLDIEIFHIDANPELIPESLGTLSKCEAKKPTTQP